MDEEKIKKQGIELIEEFSRMLEDIQETDETHYVVDLNNVTRKDGKAEKQKNYREKIRKNTPRWEEGYVVAEKGR